MYNLIEFTAEEEQVVKCISNEDKKLICKRCLNNDKSQFYKDQLGYYCLKCLIFGKSTTYKSIERRNKVYKSDNQCTLSKVIYLSEMQAKASKECLNAYNKGYDLLVFAVCGARKNGDSL